MITFTYQTCFAVRHKEAVGSLMSAKIGYMSIYACYLYQEVEEGPAFEFWCRLKETLRLYMYMSYQTEQNHL